MPERVDGQDKYVVRASTRSGHLNRLKSNLFNGKKAKSTNENSEITTLA
jgi:hypothetical protein